MPTLLCACLHVLTPACVCPCMQGDPGETRMMIDVQDPMLRVYGLEKASDMLRTVRHAWRVGCTYDLETPEQPCSVTIVSSPIWGVCCNDTILHHQHSLVQLYPSNAYAYRVGICELHPCDAMQWVQPLTRKSLMVLAKYAQGCCRLASLVHRSQ